MENNSLGLSAASSSPLWLLLVYRCSALFLQLSHWPLALPQNLITIIRKCFEMGQKHTCVAVSILCGQCI